MDTTQLAALREEVVASRRMTAVRAILEAQQRQALWLMVECRKSGLDFLVLRTLDYSNMLNEALAEVEAAERGCGQKNGDCLSPCHLEDL